MWVGVVVGWFKSPLAQGRTVGVLSKAPFVSFVSVKLIFEDFSPLLSFFLSFDLSAAIHRVF